MRRGFLAALALTLVWAGTATGEVTEQQGVRVSVQGKLAPTMLPRSGTAPVSVSFGGRITSTGQADPPQLSEVAIALNSNGRLATGGLPRCRLGHIDPSTTREALAACGSSVVGEGHFSADVRLPEQSPFPSAGKVLAFNGRFGGRPAIFAHIYGTEPAPTSYVLPFLVKQTDGTYGTVLEASLPRVTGDWGFVTGISMKLQRTFVFHGKTHSYISAGCPAPAGFPKVVFPLAKTTFSFEGGPMLSTVLNRSCKVGGH